MMKLLKHLQPVALIMLAIISYFVLALGFGVYQKVPWIHFLLAIIGCIGLVRLAREQRRWLPWVTTATGFFFTTVFAWYTLSYSVYTPRQSAVQEQQIVAGLTDLRLSDQDGQPAGLFDQQSAATLLVFYRGYW